MTILQIQMMLHYYTRPTPYAEHDPAHAGSPAVHEQRGILIKNCQMLEVDNKSSSGYVVTDKGVAYVKALEGMPLPVCKWVIEHD